MSVAALTPRHVFGVRGDIPQNVFHIDDSTILYPAGHYIVVLDKETRAQQFLPGSHESGGITAVAMSRSRKYLAMAEYGERGTVCIYDLTTLKRRKMLLASDVGSKEYVALSFSADEKYLVCQGGGPEWNAVLFLWEKGKVVHTARMSTPQAPVRSVAFSPWVREGEQGRFSVVGPGLLRSFRVDGAGMPEMDVGAARRAQQGFTCQCYVRGPSDTGAGTPAADTPAEGEGEAGVAPEPSLVIGTDQGELLVVEGGEVVQLLARHDGPGSINSLCPFSRGFVVGGSDGMVAVVERGAEDGDAFRIVKQLSVNRGGGTVTGISVAPSENSIVVSTNDNQVSLLTLEGTNLARGDEVTVTLLSAPFHSTAITGLDTCARKPIAATCSSRGSVRIWNNVDCYCELAKDFVEEAYSIALHPSGYLLLVGFADKLRLMTVLMEDLRVIKEFNIKACRECQFSNGGHLLAAVNGSTIAVYSTYTGENVSNLRGHNGKVNSIVWSKDDSKLLSTGGDGAIYMWHMDDFSRDKEVESVLKGCVYYCVAAGPDFRAFYAVGSDRLLKEVDERGAFTKEVKSGEVLTQVVLPNGARSLFASTESGLLRAYKYPLTGEHQQPEAKPHHGRITRLRLSKDSSVLFAAGEDGCLSVHEVRDVQAVGADREALPWAEEVLVTKSDLEERRRQAAELEQRLQDNQMGFEYEKRLKENHMNDEVKQRTARYMEELERDKESFERLLQDKNEMEMVYEERIKHMDEQHQHRVAALDSRFQQKIMEEVERWQSLQADKDALEQQWREQQALMLEQNERMIQELTEKFEAELEEERMNIEKLQQEREEAAREYAEIEEQMYQDFDKEIEELKERNEKLLAAERDVSLSLKGENGIMRKKFSQLQKEIQDKIEEEKEMERKVEDLRETAKSTVQDNQGLKAEIDEKDELIVEKEKKSYELKKENQELEKFKFVLDYKIKELKKQIEPKEVEIKTMKDQIKDMDRDLERFHKQNAALEASIADMRARVQSLQAGVLEQRARLSRRSTRVHKIQHDLHELVQLIQDPRRLKEKLKELYEWHVGKAQIEEVSMDADIHDEYRRQKEYLEVTVEDLKQKLAAHAAKSTAENMQAMQENVALIKEIKELRREIRDLRAKQQQLKLVEGLSGPRASQRLRGSGTLVSGQA